MNQDNYSTKRTFKQLNREKRFQLDILLKSKTSISKIAELLSVNRSTIYRELKRGTTVIQNYNFEFNQSYDLEYAVNSAKIRKQNSHKKPKYLGFESQLRLIEKKVKNNKYSFEIIAGRMKHEKCEFQVSFKTLYNYLSKKLLKIAPIYLPAYNYTKSNKENHRRNKADKSIENRPQEINDRLRFGDWEMDCIVGPKNQGSAILALSERKTRFELIYKLENKTEECVINVLDKLELKLKTDFPEIFKSITTDNGSENRDYEGIERSIINPKEKRTVQYFAHPYCSCERGTNESLNREIRKFFPKGTKFDNIKETEFTKVNKWINNKPRKVLGFKTPIELLTELNQNFALKLCEFFAA